MRWCDKHDVHFVIGLPKNNVLISKLPCETTRARDRHAQLGGKQTVFKWFRYRTQEAWARYRWVVGKAE